MLGGDNVKIKYIGSVNKVMLPGIPGTFVTGVVYEVNDNIGRIILSNPLFIRVDDDLWVGEEFWLTGEEVDEPEESPWQLKVQEVETPIEETPEIEEVSEEPVKRTRKKRAPKEPPKEIETPEETLTEPPEETKKEKEKEVNTNGS